MIDLPDPKGRATKGYKVKIVRAILANEISIDYAKDTYALSDEELEHWMHMYKHHNADGLRVTRAVHYRVKQQTR